MISFGFLTVKYKSLAITSTPNFLLTSVAVVMTYVAFNMLDTFDVSLLAPPR